jgi:hypothetical protein
MLSRQAVVAMSAMPGHLLHLRMLCCISNIEMSYALCPESQTLYPKLDTLLPFAELPVSVGAVTVVCIC